MDWSTTPPAPIAKPGWTTDPTIILPPVMQRWGVKYTRAATDTGIGADRAVLLPRIPASDTGLGADYALLDTLTGLLAADTGVGRDTALIVPELLVVDAGLGADAARPGVRAWDQGAGRDSGLIVPRFAAVDAAVGADMLKDLPRIAGTDTGIGADDATLFRFTPHAAVSTTFATVGTHTYPIAVWCRYIDIVLVGSGPGGNGGSGSFAAGHGGNAASWAAVRIERGVDIPWTATAITIVVPDGGNGGNGAVVGAMGSPGSATTASLAGWVGLSAAGGQPRQMIGILHQTGDGPGDYSFNGQPYTGGGNQTTAGGAGLVPGGAGAGGKGGFFSGSPGGKGAPGRAYLRAYQ